MNSKNAATRQDVIANSVDHQIFTLANSAASPAQMDTLLASELDHDLIAWPRQYLETYLDSDATGRVPLDAEQLQDVLEAAFDRDAALAREYLEELNAERGPKRLADSTLQIASARTERKELEYELLFDPRDTRDFRDLLEKLDIRAWERKRVQATPPLETQPDILRRESTAFVVVHQPGSGVVELHDKTQGTDVRKLLGGGELPPRSPVGPETDGSRCTRRTCADRQRHLQGQDHCRNRKESYSANHFTFRSCTPQRPSGYDPGRRRKRPHRLQQQRCPRAPRKGKEQSPGVGPVKHLTAYRKPRDPGYVGGFYWTPTIVGFIGLFFTNVLATQFLAWRFDYQPALGPALVRIGHLYLYAPYKWLVWVWTSGKHGGHSNQTSAALWRRHYCRRRVCLWGALLPSESRSH